MSVFLAIVLSCLIMFNGTFIDVIRYDAAGSILNRLVNNANISVMADYDGRFFDEYGLYVLYEDDVNVINDNLSNYINKNLSNNGLFKEEVINVDSRYFSMEDLSSLREQIIDFSKYRVPGDIIKEIVSEVKSTNDIEFITNTQDIESDLSQCEDDLDKAAKKYNDAVISYNNYLNGVGIGELDTLYSNNKVYSDLVDKCNASLNDLYNVSNECNTKVYDLRDQINQINKEKSKDNVYIKSLNSRLTNLESLCVSDKFQTANKSVIDSNNKLIDKINTTTRYDNESETEFKNRRWNLFINERRNLTKSSYENVLSNEENKKYDSRTDNVESVKELFSNDDSESKEISSETYKELPSYKYSSNVLFNYKLDSSAVNLDNDEFPNKSLDYANDLFTKVKDEAVDLYNEVLIDEYIIRTFKSKVLKDDDNAYYKDFRGKTLSSRNTYLDNEIEYIINGKLNDNDNIFATKLMIFLFRFCMNTVHVYSDSEKKAIAQAAAIAISAITGGVGSSLLSNLILWGWSMGESCIDINDLMDGKKVPVYKTKNDWKLDIGILNSNNSANNNQSFSFNYLDYLRILLLTVPKEIKLARIADLIQLNTSLWKTNFKIKDAVIGIESEAIFTEVIIFHGGLFSDDILMDKRRFIFHVEQTYKYK